MARLPQPGSDNGNWGDILNDFLSQAHTSSGSLKDNVVTAATIQDDTITETQLSTIVRSKLNATSTNCINVRDYGAIGDGIQDDSAAIKDAENHLESGSYLYFPPGDYRFAQQNPTGQGAVVLSGLSNTGIVFDPGARLLMDNLNSSGLGTSDGIRVVGAASHIALINPHVEWKVNPTSRSTGDGIRILGYPSDSAPVTGWLGSTGTVSHITILNGRSVKAPQTGMVMNGVSDVTVIGFSAEDTHADGLHFNACRRVTVNGHHAKNVGDDGLAFVTYYDPNPSQVWQETAVNGPFNQTALTEWCNSASSATGISVTGNRANGLRIQQGTGISVSGLSVRDKEFGIQVNSAKSGVGQDWTSIASQNITISDVTIEKISETGIVLGTFNIDADDSPMWWDFRGTSISNVVIRGCKNWSLSVETPDSDNTKFSGLSLSNIVAEAGDDDANDPELGGNGGIRLASLYNSDVDNIKLVSDHVSDTLVVGAAQIRGYVGGAMVTNITPEELPSSNLSLTNIINDGPGRILIQDIAGLRADNLISYNANGEALSLNRLKDAAFGHLKAHMPARGAGVGRGLGIHQCYNVDIAEVEVRTDNHVGTLWQSVELGGGDANYIAGKGVRVEKVTYISERDDTGSDVAIQGGAFGATDWHIQAYWRHEGETTPVWRSELYGSTNPAYVATTTQTPTWLDEQHGGNGTYVDFNTITTPGRYIVASDNPGFLFTDDATQSHQPPGAPGWVYLEVVTHPTSPNSSVVATLQRYFTVAAETGKSRAGYRSKIDNDPWSEWRQDGFPQNDGVVTNSIVNDAVTLPKLSSAVRTSLALADSAPQFAIPDTRWINGPVDLNTLTTAGVYIVAGEFLNGDPTTYNQPGNSGMIKLTVTTIASDPGGGTRIDCIQEYISVDGADHGGQRRRFDGSWSGWLKY